MTRGGEELKFPWSLLHHEFAKKNLNEFSFVKKNNKTTLQVTTSSSTYYWPNNIVYKPRPIPKWRFDIQPHADNSFPVFSISTYNNITLVEYNKIIYNIVPIYYALMAYICNFNSTNRRTPDNVYGTSHILYSTRISADHLRNSLL